MCPLRDVACSGASDWLLQVIHLMRLKLILFTFGSFERSLQTVAHSERERCATGMEEDERFTLYDALGNSTMELRNGEAFHQI